MPGQIVGIFGRQRSGKTLLAYKLAKNIQDFAKKSCNYDLRVYTNLFCPEDKSFIYVNCLDDLPLDLSPKIILIDEIYNGCDAQDYRKLKEISIFINTLGKQNCLFIYTSIEPNMVYNRLRNQTNVVFLVKSNAKKILYKIINLNNDSTCDYVVEKDDKLFSNVFYDTNFIPLDFDWSMTCWKNKLADFYLENYNIKLNI